MTPTIDWLATWTPWAPIVDALIKVVVSVVGIALTIYKGYVVGFRPRTALKRDLEILRMLDADDPNRQVLSAHVERSVQRLYGPRPEGLLVRMLSFGMSIPRPRNGRQCLIGAAIFAAMSFVTAYFVRHDEALTVRVFACGIFAVSGLIQVLDSYGWLDEERPPRSKRTSSGRQAPTQVAPS